MSLLAYRSLLGRMNYTEPYPQRVCGIYLKKRVGCISKEELDEGAQHSANTLPKGGTPGRPPLTITCAFSLHKPNLLSLTKPNLLKPKALNGKARNPKALNPKAV